MNYKITKAIVEEVKGYARKYPTMVQEEISKLVDISRSSVSLILKGKYDNLLNETPEENPKTVKSEIPYETYRRLVSCEMAINEILDRTFISMNDGNVLFIDYRQVSSILQRHLPTDFAERLDTLREEDEEYDY